MSEPLSAAPSPGSDRIRVAIVEDDPVLRNHLIETVGQVESFFIVGTAATLEGGVRLANANCQVLLLDLALPDGTGLDLIRQTRARGLTDLKIIVISVFGDVKNVVQAIEAGADGYLLKGGDSKETERAIRDVVAGGAPISPAVASHILARVRTNAPALSPPVRPADREGNGSSHRSGKRIFLQGSRCPPRHFPSYRRRPRQGDLPQALRQLAQPSGIRSHAKRLD